MPLSVSSLTTASLFILCMKILIAPDKFRGSLSAEEVIAAVIVGLEKLTTPFAILTQPMADGGEQTAEILAKNTGGFSRTITVNDPLFRPIKATYFIAGDGKTAFIEIAAASGLSLLKLAECNPLQTSTFGTGELILDAIEFGVEQILLCIGGSATNDAGIGMAAALGYRFLDENGLELAPIGSNLARIFQIDSQSVHPKLAQIDFEIACDVINPLHGSNGAAHVFAKQKGASEADILALDAGLNHFAAVVFNQFGIQLQNIAGAGAAGGLGGGSFIFLNATLEKGIQLVINHLGLEAIIEEVDLIITGEGKLDQQTLAGKVIQGLVLMAQKHKKPIIAFCGTLELDYATIKKSGLTAVFSITNAPMSLENAQANAKTLLADTVANVMEIYCRP